MQTFNNLKTGTKLIGGFVTVALIVVAAAVVGYVNMRSINAGLASLYNDRTLPIEQLGKANALLYTLRGDLYKYLLLPTERGTIEKAITTNATSLSAQIEAYRVTSLVKAEKDGLAKFDPAWTEYQAAATEVLNLVKAGNDTAATQSIADGGRTANARKAVGAALEALVTINVQEADKLKAQGDTTFANSTLFLALASVFGALLAIGTGAFISWTITGPLGIMASALQNLQKGDLNRSMPPALKDSIMRRQDEIGIAGQGLGQTEIYLITMAEAAAQIADGDLTATVTPRCAEDELGQAFAKMISALRHTVGQVAESAENVSAASEQLAAAATQAGAAASQQAEATTKTVSSVEEMKRAIDGVAKGAQEQAAAVGRASETSPPRLRRPFNKWPATPRT